MIVTSTQLLKASEQLAASIWETIEIREVGLQVSSEQLATAARLLQEAEPCICNSSVSERPGFIEVENQHSTDMLVLSIGILPQKDYTIARDGSVESP